MASTPAEIKAVKKYQQSRDNLMIRPTKAEGEQIRAAAAQAGQSVQAFILDAVRAHMARGIPQNGGDVKGNL